MSKLRQRDSLIKKYSFEPYSEEYPILFKGEQSRLLKDLKKLKPVIEHFGSTSIPGVGGKGIIDIFILVDKGNMKKASKILIEKLGYEFRSSGGDEESLFHQTEILERRFHVHLTYRNSSNYMESIGFRDFLRGNPTLALEYSEIKKSASENALKAESKEQMKKVYMQTKYPVMDKIMRMIKDKVG